MNLPFTVDEFFAVFERYNLAIWPAQVMAYAAAAIALGLALFRPGRSADRTVLFVLAAFWTGMGAGYHLTFFRAINPLALPAGVLFVVQGALLVLATVRGSLSFPRRLDAHAILGLAFVAYAMIAYPLLGASAGHRFPRSPVFGVAPCPTTIFTFGLLLLARGRVPGWLLPIPLAWSMVGLSAALQLGVSEDLGLPVAGVVGTAAILVRNRRAAPADRT